MVPTKGSDQGEQVLASESARFNAAEPHRRESLSSEEVVKKICFLSGCDIGSLPISGDATVPDQEYLDQLIRDKGDLRSAHAAPFRHLTRLVDKEIARVVAAISAQAHLDDVNNEEDCGEKVVLTEMILVPIDRYPKYNFVGRILGPRGMTAKQLEEDTGCKIMVRGRGSSRTNGSRRDRSSDTEPLHVLIQCEDYEKRAHQKMRNAVEAVNQLLHPPPEGKDELKRKQLIELSIINGTYRPTSATKVALQAPRPLSAPNLPPVADNSPYNEQARMFSQFAEAARFRKKNDIEEQHATFAQMFGNSNSMNVNNANFNCYDYYKNLITYALADPNFFSSLTQSVDAYGMGNRMAMQHAAQHHQQAVRQPGTTGQIPQANLHQYLTAAAMLNSAPFSNDGSGDGPRSKMRGTI